MPTTHLRLMSTGIGTVFDGGLVPAPMSKVKHAKSVLACCLMAVVKDFTTARLLHHIAYWHPRCRGLREDKARIVKTGAEWQDETSLTPKQYKRALRVLKDRGPIEVRVWKANPEAECATTFLRLSDEGAKLVLDMEPPPDSSAADQSFWPPGRAKTEDGKSSKGEVPPTADKPEAPPTAGNPLSIFPDILKNYPYRAAVPAAQSTQDQSEEKKAAEAPLKGASAGF